MRISHRDALFELPLRIPLVTWWHFYLQLFHWCLKTSSTHVPEKYKTFLRRRHCRKHIIHIYIVTIGRPMTEHQRKFSEKFHWYEMRFFILGSSNPISIFQFFHWEILGFSVIVLLGKVSVGEMMRWKTDSMVDRKQNASIQERLLFQEKGHRLSKNLL